MGMRRERKQIQRRMRRWTNSDEYSAEKLADHLRKIIDTANECLENVGYPRYGPLESDSVHSDDDPNVVSINRDDDVEDHAETGDNS